MSYQRSAARSAAFSVVSSCFSACALALLLVPASALAQAQDKGQAGCIYQLNKGAAKVAATQGKEIAGCVKAGTKAKLTTSAEVCLTADPKLKVSKARGKNTSGETKKCTGVTPSFGFTTAANGNTVSADGERSLLHDIYGSDLGVALSMDKLIGGCQRAISKAYEKLAATKIKQFLGCKKAGLRGKALPQITDAVGLSGCVSGRSDSIAGDPKNKVSKAKGRLGVTNTKKCAGVDTDAAFPGQCVGSANFVDCLDERVECRVCLMLNAMDNISADCDLFDDGAANGGCPPTTTSTTTTSTTTTTLQLSCSVDQPCAGGVECCAGTCLPPDSFCEQRCSESTTVSCLANADCQWPPCQECIGTTGQTCEPQVIRNTCGAGSCLTSESCCSGSTCCRNYDQTCSAGVCQQNCPFGSFSCGETCCVNAQLCQSGTCKTSCGQTSCFPDTESCCGDVCCDTATQICGQQPGTCVPRQTCTGTDVYIPLLDICCPQQGVCGANTACCDLALQQCDAATNQCVSKL